MLFADNYDNVSSYIFHFSSLSPGFFNVKNSIKGLKVSLYFSSIIFFLNFTIEGSTMNLGSVAKHVTFFYKT